MRRVQILHGFPALLSFLLPPLLPLLSGLSGALPSPGALADETVYLPRGSTWKYLPGLAEASSPDPTAWRLAGFDDSGWASGPAPFGYSDPPNATDLSLLVPPMQGNYVSLFLRRTFTVSDASAVARLDARANYDDGFVLWVNGVEVLRANMPVGEVSRTTVASAARESGTFEEFVLPDPGSFLVTGANVVALMGFQNQINSSDFKLDLELLDPFGPDMSPPTVVGIVPAAGAAVRALTRVEVTFGEEVLGVDAADLLVRGVPATSLTGSGAGPYAFGFPQPTPGTVQISWAPGAAITDASPQRNPFAGGAWTVTLDPDAPDADLVISEILAANATGLRDEDGETSDWIEVHNRGATAVDLLGWGLTDDLDDPGKWTFPAVALDPGAYLVVFASGKDRKPISGRLHASFKLGSDGEYLGLYGPDSPRRVASEFAPQFPPMRPDISYGIDATGKPGYFQTPTPGAPNGTSAVLEGIVQDPRIAPPRGFHAGAITVSMYTPTPDAAITYTLDGREPTRSGGILYAGPFQATATDQRAVTTIRAAAFRTGFLPSRSVAVTYVDPARVVRQPASPAGFPTSWGSAPAVDYGMDSEIVGNSAYADRILDGLLDLPSLSLVMDVQDIFGPSGLYSNPTREGVAWERPGSLELLDPGGRDGFQVNCGVRIQGGASRSPANSPKHSFRLLFKGDYGPTKLRFRLFPDTRVDSFDSFILRANYNNSWIHWDNVQRRRGTMIHDQWARDTQLAMGGLSPHGNFVHLYLNGLYWGVYNAVERPNAAFAASYLGGEKEDYDALNSAEPKDGDAVAWNAMLGLAAAGLSSLGAYEGIQGYLDVLAFADYMLLNLYGGNSDWPHHNWYAVRRREPGAQFLFASWDAERILEPESLSINRTGVNQTNSPGVVYSQLRANAEFRLLFADRVHRHFLGGEHVSAGGQILEGGGLSPGNAAARWEARVEELLDAVACESARWGDYRRDVHSYSNGPYLLYTPNDHWAVENGRIVGSYFPSRGSIVLDQLRAAGLYPAVGAPIFGKQGGSIGPGFALSMRLPSGTTGSIHYTTDGSDPRVYGTGAIAATAVRYTAEAILADTTVVLARTLSGGVWSALNEATFSVPSAADALRITEIMYHPEGGSPYEFIEIGNTAAFGVNLGGLEFTDGIIFAFAPGSVLGPGHHLVLVSDPIAFAERYPSVPIHGVYAGQLDNDGEKVTLKAPGDVTVVSVEYNDAGLWPLGPDGFGYSLVLKSTEGNPDDPALWRASAVPGGSPGAADPVPLHGDVVINEVLAGAVPPLEDAVELANPTNRPADVGGWYLSDDRQDAESLRKHRIPFGTTIPSGGFLVLYGSELGAEPGSPSIFELSATGGAVYLASANAAGSLTGHIVGLRFGAAPPGVSVGRHATSWREDVTLLEARTFGVDDPATVEEFREGTGAPNAAPLVGPVVINEVRYHPPPGEDEFAELHNRSGEAVDIGGWVLSGIRRLDGTAGYEIPPGVVLGPGGFLVLVDSDPAAFRVRHSVPAAVPVVGPYLGRLDNGGERVELRRPGGDGGDGGDGVTAPIVVDHVRYNDRFPWPLEPDGGGPSLERVRASEYGDEPLNWAASLGSPGTPGRTNSASGPGVNQRPVARFVARPEAAPLAVLFDASASEDPDGRIVRYSWDFGDGTLGEGESIVHVFPAGGTYLVRLDVEDNAGDASAASRSVTLSGPADGGLQRPGDANQDGSLDIADGVALLVELFLGGDRPLPCGGSSFGEGGNLALLDVNGDATVDIADAIATLSHLFRGGPGPVLGSGCVRISGCPEVCTP